MRAAAQFVCDGMLAAMNADWRLGARPVSAAGRMIVPLPAGCACATPEDP